MADLHHPAQSRQGFLIDLLVGQQFGVIEEIAQEPAQLPQGFLGAVEATDDGLAGQGAGLENGEAEDLERFMGMPAELGPIDAHEVHAVGDIRAGIASGFGEARELAFHATTSCFGRA